MTVISQIREYTFNRNFDGSLTCDLDSLSWQQDKPLYQFNWAEKTGNLLLAPLEKAFSFYDRAERPWAKAAAVIALTAAAILGAVGALFKTCGEKANPHAAVRNEALALVKNFYAAASAYFGRPMQNLETVKTMVLAAGKSYGNKKSDLNDLFETAVLAPKRTVAKSELENSFRGSLGFHALFLPLGRRQEAADLQKQWEQGMEQFEHNLRIGADTFEQEKALLDLAGRQLDRQAQEFFELAKRNTAFAAEFSQAAVAYNAAVQALNA